MADPGELLPFCTMLSSSSFLRQSEYFIKHWHHSSTLEYTQTREFIYAFGVLHILNFTHRINDLTVPYVTSAIEVEDPFAESSTNGIEVYVKSRLLRPNYSSCSARALDEAYSPLMASYSLPPVPPPRTPRPVLLSPGWFRSLKPERPFLPPFLQVRFPFNIVCVAAFSSSLLSHNPQAIYVLLPFLIPVFISLVITRLTLASRSSRARIKLLEKDASNSEKLVHILAQLERQVEDAVVDFIDDPDPSPAQLKKKPSPEHPILTPLQRKIAASLNKLPIEKKLTYIRGVRNAHAVIVCRDVKRFEAHRVGEGVLRNWADSFDL